jgi:TM2 domain-containing membrane protein YozV
MNEKEEEVELKSLPHKNLGITILLGVLVSGVGHIYLGIIKKGIIILIIGIAIAIIVPVFVPYPFSWIIGGVYWVWQLVDAIRSYRKRKSGLLQ